MTVRQLELEMGVREYEWWKALRAQEAREQREAEKRRSGRR